MAAEVVEALNSLGRIASFFGTTEPALRLLISILLGYPLAFAFRNFIYERTPVLQHVCFTISGIALCYFNYGTGVIHSLGCVLVLYILLIVGGGTVLSVAFAFVYFLGYLLLGYYFTETNDYDITWTMPHCVLTLRAIGLVFDVYDGKKKPEELSTDQKETALTKVPSLLEIAGFMYFFGGCLVGPQFSVKRYLKYVNKELIPTRGKPDSIVSGLSRGGIGIIYLIIFLIGNSYIPANYVFTDNFRRKNLLMRFILMGLWGKICCLKYIISWVLSEGSCMMTGITYNGKDNRGEDRWDGCSNVLLLRYETATKFGHVVQSFNMLTNKWAAVYIYKRLRFLGNKLLSQAVTLAFLAIWHGLHVAYYFVFLLEFFVMKLEHDVEDIVSRSSFFSTFLNQTPIKQIKLVLQRLYMFVFFSYCVLPFVIISWETSNQVYGELYFLGHFLYFGWIIGYSLFKQLTRSSKLKSSSENGFKMDKAD